MFRCFCGNQPPQYQYLDVDDVHCSYACAGNSLDTCGGNGGYISIYYDATKYTPSNSSTSTAPIGGPVTVNSTGNYNYIGCYSEATAGRALSALSPNAPANGFTVELCQAACEGYTYFGVEYSNQCMIYTIIQDFVANNNHRLLR